MSDYQVSAIYVLEVEGNIETTKASERKENNIGKDNASYWNILHILTTIATSTFILSLQLLIPRHNSIYYPEYWYETNILGLVVALTATIKFSAECAVYTKENSLLSISMLVKMYLGRVLPMLTLFYLSNFTWTSLLEFQHPMPLLGIFVFFGTWFIFLCSFASGMMFPSTLRRNSEFRAKVNLYLYYEMWWFCMNLQKELLTFAFNNIYGELQFLFAFVIPVAKAMNKKVLSKLVSKMASEDDEMAFMTLTICLNIFYSLFIAIRLNGAEMLTVISIIVVDFLTHLRMTHQIVKL